MAVNWAPVGERLAKQQDVANAAFDTRLGQRVARGRQEEDLKQELMKTTALRGVEDALIASGADPKQARLGALAVQGGFGADLSNVGQYQLRNQELGFRQGAVDAARAAGDVSAANPYLAGVATGPLKVTDLESGQLYNPYGRTDQQVALTALGQAALDTQRSMAEENRAQADKARRAPAGAAGKQGAFTAPAAGSLQAAFTNKDGSFATQSYAKFQRWRNQHPEYRSGDEALAAYIGAISGDAPPPRLGSMAVEEVPEQDDATVADIGPEEDTFVVTEDTGPQGVRLSELAGITGEATGRTQVAGAREGYQPTSRKGQDFQAAQAAIEAGKNYEAVVQRMKQAGYPDAEKILKRKR